MRTQPRTQPTAEPRAQHGFTLIELIVSAAVGAMIIAASYLCLSAAFSSQSLVDARTDALQRARAALALIAADLRAACPLAKDTEFVGMQRTLGTAQADNLDFATHHTWARDPDQGDWTAVSYFLDKAQDSNSLSLWRRRNPFFVMDPFSGGSREFLIEGVAGLRFEYFDGLEWFDNWGPVPGATGLQADARPNSTGIPEAVRITLSLETEPKPKSENSSPQMSPVREANTSEAPRLVLQTVVRIEVPASSHRSAASSDPNIPPAAGSPTL